MSVSTFALDQTRLGVFGLCLNQERALLARTVTQQMKPPPSLIRFGFRLEGRSSSEAVEAALIEFIGRHPALRTSFAENILLSPEERRRRIEAFARTGSFESGLFVQQVHEEVVPPVTALDWTRISQAEQDETLRRIVRSEELRPFNDSDPYRLRPLYIRVGTARALLILTFDHVVFDGFSASITCRELERRLSTQSESHTGSTRAVAAPDSFLRFAEWQRRALHTSYFRSSIAFWRDVWARFARYRLSFEDLPFSRPAPPEPDYAFATEHAVLIESESTALKAFAGEAKTTVFAICLAALARVLSEYAGRSSVAIWSHLLNRVQPGTLDAVGYFANTHLLGIDLSSNATGRELVRHVGRVIMRALTHQELPLPFLWTTLRCVPRFTDVHILMDFRPQRVTPMHGSSGINIESMALPDSTTPRFSSLGIYVNDNGDTIELSVKYWHARFSTSGVQGLLRYLRETILSLVNDPDTSLRRSSVDRVPNATMEEFLLLDSTCIPFAE